MDDICVLQAITMLVLLTARGIEGDERMQENSAGFVSSFFTILKNYLQNVRSQSERNEMLQAAEAASCNKAAR